MKRLVRVAGESMAPTYRSSDLLLTWPVGRGGASVARGDAVIFRRGDARMIKRVVGLAGDVVEMEAGRLSVNGKSVDGRPGVRGAFTQTWQVPGDSYFMAGDNPAASDDSRVWDEPFVAAGSVVAVVTRRLMGRPRTRRWPPSLTPRRPVAAFGPVERSSQTVPCRSQSTPRPRGS